MHNLCGFVARFDSEYSVKKGDIIGYVGNTGNSTGPHLHFEVISDDVKYDPVEWYK